MRKRTTGERVCTFIEKYIIVPEGPLVGQLMKLEPFQEVFILALFDGDMLARFAMLSVGRKAGKTALIAALLLAFMFMEGLTARNSRINSAALSREQAALVFNYMQKSIAMSTMLSTLSRVTSSGKRIVALNTGIEYHALAAEAGRAMGLSPAVLVGDEWGQILGPSHPFIDALMTAQGAHEHPLAIIISTQAPSDADFLSILIDDAIRNPQPDVVCHLYMAPVGCALDDPVAWHAACPAIGVFRSRADVERQAFQAKRLPTKEAAFRSLILNQRIALERLWLAPTVWKENNGVPDPEIFREKGVHIGLDLSQKMDLTVACMAQTDDDGNIHVQPFAFTPLQGLRDRSLISRVPYEQWVNDGVLIAVPGKLIDYDWVCAYLRLHIEQTGILVHSIQFDRWRIAELKAAADREGFAQGAAWQEVGQGFKDMAPRVDALEGALLQGRIRHGLHPVLNLGAASAIVVASPAGDRKLDKSKATQKIDGLVAMLMAVYPLIARIDPEFSVEMLVV
jgi:phage terminase large subunit-like protein